MNGGDVGDPDAGKVYEDAPKSIRRTLAQVIATMTQSLLLLSLGMLVSAPTVVIAGLYKRHNGTELVGESSFTLTDRQASWFAGTLMIMQPLGSITAGILQDRLGRKKCMLLVNVPQLGGWSLAYLSGSPGVLLLSAALMGFSLGFLEAPTLSYVAEITEPHLRGTLASFTSLYVAVGTLVMFLLGTATDWRTAMAISAAVPVIIFIALTQIPESPVWLAMQGRKEEAMTSLCWLRGWVEPEVITKEFRQMVVHAEASKLQPKYTPVSTNEVKLEEPVAYKPTLKEKLKDLTRPEMVKPLCLVVTYFLFLHCGALSGFKPYLIMVLTRLEVPIRPQLGTVAAGVLQIAGSITCISCVRKVGRRKMSLFSMVLCTIITFLLGLYSYLQERQGLKLSWLPLVLVALLFFSSTAGITVIPWTLLGEVFPARGRGIGGGVSAAMYYIWYFLASKTFLNLVSILELFGVFFFYSFTCVCGIVFLYKCLPETEGKSLQDVEKFFMSKSKRDANPI